MDLHGLIQLEQKLIGFDRTGRTRIESRLLRHPYQSRPCEQGLPYHIAAVVRTVRDGKALQERAQYRTAVDVDLRLRLILPRGEQHRGDPEGADDDGHQKRAPAKSPGGHDDVQEGFDLLFHTPCRRDCRSSRVAFRECLPPSRMSAKFLLFNGFCSLLNGSRQNRPMSLSYDNFEVNPMGNSGF